jgi:hypothetical protein
MSVVLSKFASIAKREAVTLQEVTMADLGSSFSKIAYPEWQLEYQAALRRKEGPAVLNRIRSARQSG